MIKQIFGSIFVVALLAACSGTPEIQTGDDAEVIMGDLHKVDNSRADMAYVDPNADFAKYNKILLMPLGVDNVEIIQPNTSSSMYRNKSRNWELTDDDKIKLQEVFRESMVKQLDSKGGYSVVTEPGDDVLQIQASLLAIAPSAAKDDNRSRPTGRSRVYTEGAGSIAVMVAFGDSESGEVLGIMKDSRSSTNNWGANNSVTNMSDVRNMFNSWAIGIRKGLDNIHGK
ncbi:MAG: DUF3313 domain-containing protein [Gammaproteobacteria bacterium]|nr:MAG: DUF3313 domain-containing protein [Gammaproteobacteria bacterium]